MKAIIILLLQFSFVSAGFREHFQQYDTSVLEKAVNNVMQSSETHDVSLIINQARETDRIQLITDTIINNVSKRRPTQLIDVNKVKNITKEYLSSYATSRTLVIYIYSGRSVLNMEDGKKIVVDTWNISYTNRVPKLLLITILDEKEERFREYLQILWEGRILDSTILEVTYCGESRKLCLTVHQLNPFSDRYTREPYSPEDTVIFPEKLRNLHGKPFTLAPSTEYPYMVVQADRNGDPVIYGMLFGYLLALRAALNVTFQLPKQCSTSVYGGMTYVDLDEFSHPGVDLFTSLYTLSSYPEIATLTVPVIESKMRFCYVDRHDPPSISFWKIFVTILMGLIVFTVFRLFLIALRIDKRLGKMMNFVRLILGMGIEDELVSLTERILFIFLVVAITRYSSIFYTELFNLGITASEGLKIKNMEDLSRHGMKIGILPKQYEMYFQGMQLLRNVKPDKVTMLYFTELKDMITNLATETNLATLLPEVWCKITATFYLQRFKRILRSSEYYMGRTLTSFILAWKSPYKERIDNIFLHTSQSGLNDVYVEYYRSVIRDLTADEMKLDKLNKKSVSNEVQVLRILYCGYVISVLILIAEILVHRRETRKREMEAAKNQNESYSGTSISATID